MQTVPLLTLQGIKDNISMGIRAEFKVEGQDLRDYPVNPGGVRSAIDEANTASEVQFCQPCDYRPDDELATLSGEQCDRIISSKCPVAIVAIERYLEETED